MSSASRQVVTSSMAFASASNVLPRLATLLAALGSCDALLRDGTVSFRLVCLMSDDFAVLKFRGQRTSAIDISSSFVRTGEHLLREWPHFELPDSQTGV
jgi:hypothetical protein